MRPAYPPPVYDRRLRRFGGFCVVEESMPSLLARRFIVASALAVVAAGLAVPCSPVDTAAAAPRDRPTVAELDRRIAAAARRLEVIVEQYNESRDDLRTNLTRQRALGSRIGPMTEDLRRRQDLIGGMAGQTYRRTVRGPAVALFGADD